MAREGATLWICSRTSSELEKTARLIRELGGRVEARIVDLADWGATNVFVTEVLSVSSRIDVLVNNAGVLRLTPMEKLSRAEWSETIAVNLTAPFQLTQGFLPSMVEHGGSVINVSSRAGIMGFAEEAAYCASKFGLEGLTRALAVELAGKPVSVNTLTPGLRIKPTSLTEKDLAETKKEKRAQWNDPDVLVPAFIFLAGLRGEVTGLRFHAERLSRAVLKEGFHLGPDHLNGLAE